MYFPSGLGAYSKTPPTAAAASSAPPAAQLQNALKALGTTSGDPLLMKVAVDGVVGPKTVAAVNHALANYVGGTPAFPRADLTVAKVRQYAGALATLVSQRVQKSGGTVPAAVIKKSAPRAPSGPFPTTALDVTAPASGLQLPQWAWYAIGGGGLLILLMAGAAAVKRKRATA